MRNIKQFKRSPLAQAMTLSLAIFTSAAQADDVEVYVTTEVTIGPNILFIVDESGSMNWTDDYGKLSNCSYSGGGYCNDPDQRMYQLRKAMNLLVSDEKMNDVNMAILGYSGTRNNTKIHSDFVKVGEGSNRANLIDNIIGDYGLDTDYGTTGKTQGTLITSGGTPSTPAIKQGMAWFRSSSNSPIENWCEPNYMVFLTDGEPNRNEGDTAYESVNCDANEPDITGINWSGTDGSANGARCSATIAQWGYNHRPKSGETWTYGDNDPEKKLFRNIVTHTIGFYTNAGSEAARVAKETYLKGIANRSLDEDPNHASYSFDNSYGADLPGYDENDPYTGGQFIRADSADSLLSALTAFVDLANQKVEYTYTAPSIPFNADHATVSGDEMYVPIFKPGATEFWEGNLKKYRVRYNTSTDNVDILAKSGVSAIDNAFRFQSSTDFWNDTGSTDGADPLLGGANSKMASERHLYTYLGSEKDLTDSVNRVHPDNLLITKELMGISTENGRNNRLNWANWLRNDGTTPRSGDNAPHMGAPLHTKPVTVRYAGANDLVLLNTTEGILHAFDGTTGSEVWAYMPDELLKTIKKAKKNRDKDLPMYGLDGPMTLYSIDTVYQDNDHDGFPDEDTNGDPIIITPGRTFIVMGMRRGGSNYYALDITNREAPKFVWEILGGTGSGDFGELGQTWSKPIFTKVELEGNDAQEVLIFGGGYDPDQDDATTRGNDNRGNAIYIVNAKTGALISNIDSVEQGTMGNAIAADILTVDINANGVTDRLYAADVGGRLIRVDIPDKALAQITSSSDIRATVVADMGGADGDAAFQRFFNTPEVAYYKRGGSQYLALLIASGKRPDPVDTSVTDRFYMVKDANVWSAPTTYPDVVTEDDLYDSTANLIQEGSDSEILDATNDLLAANGWYINLTSGEKGFSEAKVYDFAVLFTTYKGTREEPDVCTATSVDGESFLYILDMRHGGARFGVADGKFQQSDDPGTNDRKISLEIPGMPPSPTLMFPAGDGGTGPSGWVLALVGLQAPAKWPDHYHPISWEEVIED
jgi:type IV pilus assembly protein PilY1